MTSFPITPRNRVRRRAQRGHYDRATIYAILDAAFVAHVAYVRAGQPAVVPMLYARREDALIFHGAPQSGIMQHLARGGEVAVSVALVDGLVITKAVAELSVNYRSVVVFGHGRWITDPAEKRAALYHLTEHIVPGHWQAINEPGPKDLARVAVAEVPIELASAKVRHAPPHDAEPDQGLPVWAGYIPVRWVFGPPQPADYAQAIPLPDALRERYGLDDPNATRPAQLNPSA